MKNILQCHKPLKKGKYRLMRFPQRAAEGVNAAKSVAGNGLLRASGKGFSLSMRDGAGSSSTKAGV